MSDLKWWQRPIRMMRREYIADLQRMAEADKAELARAAKEDWHINCEWVIGTPGIAPGMGWQTTFNTVAYPKYAPLGDHDLLREYVPHAHEQGIHVLAYLNMHWYSYDFGDQHPDWEQVLSDGTPYGRANPLYGSGTTLCVNSGWRDWAFGLIREAMHTGIDGCFLDGPVIYPGACYCPACRRLFEAQYGAPIPPAEDWSDPRWKDFISFREDSMARFLREAGEALREVNPEGIVFLNGGSWGGGAWRVARDIEKVGPFEDLNGAEAFFHPGPRQHMLLAWAAAAKHLVGAGKPAVVFSHHCLGAWHYLPLPPVEAKLAAAQTVACGANPWIAVFDYSMDNAPAETLEPIREINGFLEGIEQYCVGARSGAEVALLYSAQSAKFYLSQVNDLFADTAAATERDLGVTGGSGQRVADLARRKSMCDQWQGTAYRGWFEALTREHVPFDVILDTGVTEEGLRQHRTVILPNATCLSDAQLEALVRFAQRGGNLIASFESGQYDERGDPRAENPLWPLLGLLGLEGAFTPAAMEQYVQVQVEHPAVPFAPGRSMPRPVNCLKVVTRDAETPVRVLNPIPRVYQAPRGVSEYPAMVCKQVGDSRRVYFAGLVEGMVTDYQMQDLQRWLAAAVRWAHGREMPLVAEAPGSLQIELWRQPGRLLVHLVNATGDGVRPIAETIPLHDISLRVKSPQPCGVHRASGGALTWEYADGETAIGIPELGLYDVVVLELPPGDCSA
ncbi:MAG: beta-galactosidase trimerization domain-containing protein [Armatimonadota bacterium]